MARPRSVTRVQAPPERGLRDEHFRALIEHASDIITVLSRDGIIRYESPSVRPVLGYTPEELIGTSAFDLVHPDDVARVAHTFAEAVRQGLPTQSVEFRFRHKDGSFRVVEAIGNNRLDDADIAGVVINARDVTQRRRAEEEKAALLELARDITGTFDLQDILERVQRRTAALLPCDSVLTLHWDPERKVFRLVSQVGVAVDIRDAAAALEFPPGEPLVEALTRGQTVVIADGEPQGLLPAEVMQHLRAGVVAGTPLLARGRLLGALVAANGGGFDAAQIQLLEGISRHVAVAIEATDLYRAQEEEAHVAAALAAVARELISSLNSPTLLTRLCRLTAEALGCDFSCTVLWQADDNAYLPAAAYGATAEEWEVIRLLKLPPEAISGLLEGLERDEFVEVLPSFSPALTVSSPAVASLGDQYGISASINVALRRGSEMIGYHTAGYRGRRESFTSGQQRIARGIAQLASLALETARLVRELERASHVKSEFVATMSHELRTPLNIILGYSDLLLENAFGPLAPDQVNTLRRMEKSGRELLDLINATLDLSRLESGRMSLELRDVSLAELIHDLDTETRPLQERPGVSFVCHVPPLLPPLCTDPLKLKVVLKNLIVNALKFTEQGSVMVDVYARDAGVEICVADTGIGIPPQSLPIIFDQFRQAHGGNNRRHGGVGLGLYIARRLVDMLGGSISVESEPGRGSIFRVRVPNRTASSAGGAPPQVEA